MNMNSLLVGLCEIISALCFYMVIRNHRQGRYIMSAFWIAPLLASLRVVLG
jgi:hypothetical protein